MRPRSVCEWVVPLKSKKHPTPALLRRLVRGKWCWCLSHSLAHFHNPVNVWFDRHTCRKSSLYSCCLTLLCEQWGSWPGGWHWLIELPQHSLRFSVRQEVGKPLRKREVRSWNSPAGCLMQSREEWWSKHTPTLSRKKSRGLEVFGWILSVLVFP